MDKIFYFVGTNTFSQKFHPKQLESDAAKDVQNSGNLGISSCDKIFLTVAGVNILRYSQIKYLGKVSIFWYFGEEFPHFYQCFKTLFQILMKNANNFVESMIYALLLGKSFSLTFGKGFLGFRKIFTPAQHLAMFNYYRQLLIMFTEIQIYLDLN